MRLRTRRGNSNVAGNSSPTVKGQVLLKAFRIITGNGTVQCVLEDPGDSQSETPGQNGQV